MRRWLLTVACLALVCPIPRLAAQQPLSVGIAGGASIPTGDLRTGTNTGWHALGTIGLSTLMQPIGLRLDVAYNRFGTRSPTTIGATNLSVGSATLNGSYRLPMTDSPISPYLISGLGAYRTDCSGGTAGCGASTRYGWNVGLGTKMNLIGLRPFLEARYHRTKGVGGTVQFFPITLGLMF